MSFNIQNGVLVEYTGTCEKKVIVPDGVKAIGNKAFQSVSSMTDSIKEIVLPDGLLSVGDDAFNSRMELEKINIPSSVQHIGWAAFHCCWSLKSITVPEGITSISGFTFWSCKMLNEVKLPESLTEIGRNAFGGCTGLRNITIPENVSVIGCEAFKKCTTLRGINIPEKVDTIGNNTFQECRSLNSLTLTCGGKTADIDLSCVDKYSKAENKLLNNAVKMLVERDFSMKFEGKTKFRLITELYLGTGNEDALAYISRNIKKTVKLFIDSEEHDILGKLLPHVRITKASLGELIRYADEKENFTAFDMLSELQ